MASNRKSQKPPRKKRELNTGAASPTYLTETSSDSDDGHETGGDIQNASTGQPDEQVVSNLAAFTVQRHEQIALSSSGSTREASLAHIDEQDAEITISGPLQELAITPAASHMASTSESALDEETVVQNIEGEETQPQATSTSSSHSPNSSSSGSSEYLEERRRRSRSPRRSPQPTETSPHPHSPDALPLYSAEPGLDEERLPFCSPPPTYTAELVLPARRCSNPWFT